MQDGEEDSDEEEVEDAPAPPRLQGTAGASGSAPAASAAEAAAAASAEHLEALTKVRGAARLVRSLSLRGSSIMQGVRIAVWPWRRNLRGSILP